MKPCKDLLSGISDFVDGSASDELCEEIRRHMEGCENCRVVVDTTRRTVQLFKGDELLEELPADFKERLHGSLRDAWIRKNAH
ncbi:MAG: zf-HC2 domain-containing protein [Fibrobacterota bacterium]|nr:zf-HC2 domain-containing protein [Fibrobacterota bacterium]QQS04318.1 MAG: zf-HC2 domain-containing protein [Fibrobacterota bacterium]